MKRADTDEDKELRKLELQNALLEMLPDTPFPNITFTKLAQKTGWSRGNIYRYYRTVDEIGYEMCVKQLDSLISKVNACISEDDDKDLEKLADRMADIMLDKGNREFYGDIYMMTSKDNIRPELLESGESRLHQRVIEFSQSMEKRFGIDMRQGLGIYYSIWYAFLGLSPAIRNMGVDSPNNHYQRLSQPSSIRKVIRHTIIVNIAYFL